eukprot:12690679-Alexandrium_andersonii.AAC.1
MSPLAPTSSLGLSQSPCTSDCKSVSFCPENGSRETLRCISEWLACDFRVWSVPEGSVAACSFAGG